MHRIALRTLTVLLGLAAAAPAVACDVEKLSATVSDVAGAQGELRWRKAAQGLLAACELRPRVQDMLELLPAAKLAEVPKIDRRAAEDDPSAWEGACPGGAETLTKALGQTGGVRHRTLYAECELSRFKVATVDQFARASGAPLLSILVAKHLDEQRIHEGLSGPLVRALAGLDATTAGDTPGTDVWSRAKALSDSTADVAWNAWTEDKWKERAFELVALCDLLLARPDAERREHRATEYRACSQAGRAADNANHGEAPLFREVQGLTVNWGTYVAGAVAMGDAMLLEHETDRDLAGSVSFYVGQIKASKLPAAPPASP